jgi:methyl-accepting chemotaxis protein
LMGTSVSMVEEGANIINMSNDYYQKIIDSLAVTIVSLQEINDLSKEQQGESKSVSEFMYNVGNTAEKTSQNVEYVSSSTQQTFAASEELLNTAQSLDIISNNLLKTISVN